jgi:hypothetical protein
MWRSAVWHIHAISLECAISVIKVAKEQIPLLYQNLEAYYTASHTGSQLQSWPPRKETQIWSPYSPTMFYPTNVKTVFLLTPPNASCNVGVCPPPHLGHAHASCNGLKVYLRLDQDRCWRVFFEEINGVQRKAILKYNFVLNRNVTGLSLETDGSV